MSSPGQLAGLTIVITRARTQASVLAERFEALDAATVSVSTIEIAEPLDGGAALQSALARASDFAQIAVASPNGARKLAAAAAGLDIDSFPPVACVGPSTARALDGSGLVVNLIPDRAVAEGLVDAMAAPGAEGDLLLLVQAEVARDVLEHGLRNKGWQVERVTAYRTIDAEVSDADRAAVSTGDIVTFTSSSTVERYLRLVGADKVPPTVASIGPITTATAVDLGLTVDVEADPHTIDGLVDAVVHWATTARRGDGTSPRAD